MRSRKNMAAGKGARAGAFPAVRAALLAGFGLLAATSYPALAQKQEYPSWMFDVMVPTGPHLQNLEQAQPVPGAAPSHWGGVTRNQGVNSFNGKTMPRGYSAKQSLAPPPNTGQLRNGEAVPDVIPTPRAVQIQR